MLLLLKILPRVRLFGNLLPKATFYYTAKMEDSLRKKTASEDQEVMSNDSIAKEDPKDELHPQRKKRNKKRRQKADGVTTQPQEKAKKKPPNYFLGVQITNPIITGGMKAVQDSIVSHDKRLQQAVVNVVSAHLTLAILHLPDEDAVKEACQVLDKCKEELQNILDGESVTLDVSAIGNFGNKVLFAKIMPGRNADNLERIAELMDTKFDALKSENRFDYKPHITLMKLSKAPKLRKKVRNIESDYYRGLDSIKFGIQQAESIQLLSMLKKKQKSGYYHCEHDISLDVPERQDDHSVKDILQKVSHYAEFLASYNTVSAYCQMVNNSAKLFDANNNPPSMEMETVEVEDKAVSRNEVVEQHEN